MSLTEAFAYFCDHKPCLEKVRTFKRNCRHAEAFHQTMTASRTLLASNSFRRFTASSEPGL